jgi:rubredoxin
LENHDNNAGTDSKFQNMPENMSCPLNDPHWAKEFVAVWHLRKDGNMITMA